MLARRLNHLYPITQLSNEVDRLFGDLFPDFSIDGRFGLMPRHRVPATNIWDDSQNVYVETELPGLKIEDIEVLINDNELTVKGEYKEEKREGVAYYCRERRSGTFHRSVSLPTEVDADRVQASFRDGILLVTLPKVEVAKPRKVEVKVATG